VSAPAGWKPATICISLAYSHKFKMPDVETRLKGGGIALPFGTSVWVEPAFGEDPDGVYWATQGDDSPYFVLYSTEATTSNTPQCIITGCQLSAPGFTQHGDLFVLADVYIFNGMGQPNYGCPQTSNKIVTLDDENHLHYFERRNVYVFAKATAQLNDAAQAYIAGSRA